MPKRHGKASSNETGESMSAVGMMLASLGLVFPAWLIWRAVRSSIDLDGRLAQGDASLLNDGRYTVDRVTLGPAGTELIEDAQFVTVASIPQAHNVTAGGDSHR